jgi:hypothetical protein
MGQRDGTLVTVTRYDHVALMIGVGSGISMVTFDNLFPIIVAPHPEKVSEFEREARDKDLATGLAGLAISFRELASLNKDELIICNCGV